MPSIKNILEEMKRNPKGIRFEDLRKVCEYYFGEARNKGTSHLTFKTPWKGDPRINIQNDHGKAKAYQVKQVVAAIEKLSEENERS